MLIASRVLGALALGIFWSLAAATAAQLVAGSERGRAIARVLIGVSLANTLGIPLGTFLGHLYGWRVAFGFLSGASTLATLFLLGVLPAMPALPHPSLKEQLTRLAERPVLLTLGVSVLVMTGHFTAFTFIVPYLHEVARLTGRQTSLLLVLFGAASLLGNILSGRIVDRKPDGTLRLALTGLTVALGLFSALADGIGPAVLVISLWGLALPAFLLAIQYRLIRLAPRAAETGTAFLVSLNNVGIGLGAACGGWVVHAVGLRSIGYAGAAGTLAALVLTFLVTQPAKRTTPGSRHPAA